MELTKTPARKNMLDGFGVAASLLCAVHCAVMPSIIGLLPLVGLRLLSSPATEWCFVGVSLTLGLSSLLPGYFRRHKTSRPILFFGVGLGLLLIARLAFDGFWSELTFVLVGASLIISSHFINRQLCRACTVCDKDCL
jgi:hypothetical protein